MGNAQFFYSWQRKSRNRKIIIISSIAISLISVTIFAFLIYNLYAADPETSKENTQMGSDMKEGLNPDLNMKPPTADPPTIVDNRDHGIFSGTKCDVSHRRPITLTVSSDTAARPPLGLSQADMIFEIPSTGSTARHTRLLALYSCNAPEKVRSIRSSRKFFADYTMAMDGIMGHWGGSPEGKTYFNSLSSQGKLFRIDALAVRDNKFTRDYSGGVSRKEDSGTANVAELYKYAESKGWDITTNFQGYLFLSDEEIKKDKAATAGRLSVKFNSTGDRVYYDYDPTSNTYKRFWGGKTDTDGSTGEQIAASNVIVLRTKIVSQSDPHYAYVTTSGSDVMTVYQNGQVINGTWERGEDHDSKLFFKDASGDEIKLTPGQTWIEVVEASNAITWSPI